MKRKVTLEVAGETVFLEWDSMFRGYTAFVRRNEGLQHEGQSVPSAYFLGRIGRYVGPSGAKYWGNDRCGWVKHDIACDRLEAAVERLVLLFQQDRPRPS